MMWAGTVISVIHTSSSWTWPRNKGWRGSGVNEFSQFLRQCPAACADSVRLWRKCPYTEEEEEHGRWGSQWVDFLRSRLSSRLLGRGEDESVRERFRERFLFGNTVQGPSLCCWWEEGSFGPERWCAAELGWVLDRKERRKEVIYHPWLLNTAASLWPDEHKMTRPGWPWPVFVYSCVYLRETPPVCDRIQCERKPGLSSLWSDLTLFEKTTYLLRSGSCVITSLCLLCAWIPVLFWDSYSL